MNLLRAQRVLQTSLRPRGANFVQTTLTRGISTSKNGEHDDCGRDKSAAEETGTVASTASKLPGRPGKLSSSSRAAKTFGSDATALSQRRSKAKYTLVPKVPTTEYISIADIETEGLFAGYRPLFLGKSTLEASEYFSRYDTRSLLSSLANSKLVDILTTSLENTEKRAQLRDALEEIKSSASNGLDQTHDQGTTGPRTAPVIPWDASIGGMVYSDEPFRNVPRDVVSTLKPYQPVQGEATNTTTEKENDASNSMIVMKVHNPRINDDLEMINLFSTGTGEKDNYYNKNPAGPSNSSTSKEIFKSLAKTRDAFATEHKKMAYDHKFVNDDQQRIKKEIKTLLKYLSDVFYKQSGLSVFTNTKACLLPLHVYVQLSKASSRSTRNFLRQNIMDQIFPIYNSILASFDSPNESKQFEREVSAKVSEIVNRLSQNIPSICFTDSSKSVDCLTRSGPVPGFGRMYWLKPTKRYNTFWGRNSNKDFTLKLNNNTPVTRNGVRYMRYPNNIYWKPMKEAFDNWDYLTKV